MVIASTYMSPLVALLITAFGAYLFSIAKKYKETPAWMYAYTFVGIIAVLWGLTMLFAPYEAGLSGVAAAFGICAFGTYYSKGNVQAVLGAASFLIFLIMISPAL